MVSTKKAKVRVSKITTDEKKQYDNEMHFVLWPNKLCDPKKKQPGMRGEITINGVKYRLSGWVKLSQDGSKYINGDVQLADEPIAQTVEEIEDFMDELPY
jgi:hypothetical protein